MTAAFHVLTTGYADDRVAGAVTLLTEGDSTPAPTSSPSTSTSPPAPPSPAADRQRQSHEDPEAAQRHWDALLDLLGRTLQ